METGLYERTIWSHESTFDLWAFLECSENIDLLQKSHFVLSQALSKTGFYFHKTDPL